MISNQVETYFYRGENGATPQMLRCRGFPLGNNSEGETKSSLLVTNGNNRRNRFGRGPRPTRKEAYLPVGLSVRPGTLMGRPFPPFTLDT